MDACTVLHFCLSKWNSLCYVCMYMCTCAHICNSVATIPLEVYHDIIHACITIHHDISIVQNRWSQNYQKEILADHLFQCKSHFSILHETFQCMTSPLLVFKYKLAIVTIVEAEHSVPCSSAQAAHLNRLIH